MTITFSSCEVVFAFCFAIQSCLREILSMCWTGFSNSLSRFVYCLTNNDESLLMKPYYILVINLSVSICYLEYQLKPNNKTFCFSCEMQHSLRLSRWVLTTNTHTYQSFNLLKSLFFYCKKWITFEYFVSRFALTRSALYRAYSARQY